MLHFQNCIYLFGFVNVAHKSKRYRKFISKTRVMLLLSTQRPRLILKKQYSIPLCMYFRQTAILQLGKHHCREQIMNHLFIV